MTRVIAPAPAAVLMAVVFGGGCGSSSATPSTEATPSQTRPVRIADHVTEPEPEPTPIAVPTPEGDVPHADPPPVEPPSFED